MRYGGDDNDLDVRNPLERHEAPGGGGLAIASMVLGICGAVLIFAGCGCGCFFGPFAYGPWGIAVLLAIVGIVLGFMGNTPGNGGFAWTGIICGFATIAVVLILTVLAVLGLAAFMAAAANHQPPARF